jgi:hypothetical protein
MAKDYRDLAQLKISCNAFGLGPKIPFQLEDDQAKEEFLALIPPLTKCVTRDFQLRKVSYISLPPRLAYEIAATLSTNED